MQPLNAVIHTTSVELLQTIVARGEIDTIFIESIEAIVVGKLYFCVHLGRLDLQNKLLHVLHSLISASTAEDDSSRRPVLAPKPRQGERLGEMTVDVPSDASARGYNINPLLIQTLVDGISVPTNRPILQHWLDFILMAVPQFQPALQAVVTPLNDCICKQLQTALDDIMQVASRAQDSDDDILSSVTDADFVMLLNGLERLVLLSLAYTSDLTSQEDDATAGDKSADSGGLLGYVSTVFSSENLQATTEEQLTVSILCSIIYSVILTRPFSSPARQDIGHYKRPSAFCTRFGVLHGPNRNRGHLEMNHWPSYLRGCGYGAAVSWSICFVFRLLKCSRRSWNAGTRMSGYESVRCTFPWRDIHFLCRVQH